MTVIMDGRAAAFALLYEEHYGAVHAFASRRVGAAAADEVAAEDPAGWEAGNRWRAGDREVLALIAWEELSVAEAARVLGCSAPQFSLRLFRARRRLERLLASTTEPSIAIVSNRTEARHAP